MFFIMLSLHFVYLKFDFQTINQIHLLLKTQGISAENISDIEVFKRAIEKNKIKQEEVEEWHIYKF